jgi:hypothetical protein
LGLRQLLAIVIDSDISKRVEPQFDSLRHLGALSLAVEAERLLASVGPEGLKKTNCTLCWLSSPYSRAFGAAVLVWSLVSVAVAWRNAVLRPDPVTALDTEFRTLASVLPPLGEVGFLRYDVDDDRADRVMAYYVAQYTLAPRLVLKRTDLEFLIVAADAVRPGIDERLAGFVPIASSREGYLVYRRRGK